MSRLKALLALGALVVVAVCASIMAVPDKTTSPPVVVLTYTCTEDMPCWDCETMGNHICGKERR